MPKFRRRLALTRTLILTLLAAFVLPAAQAQTAAAAPAAPHLAYDVATIRASKPGNNGMSIGGDKNFFVAENVSFMTLLANAFSIRTDLISGEPGWARDAHYDIHAKILDADPEALKKLTGDDRDRMLQALLVQRFHLKTHTEVKTLPIYDLVLAKGGSKLPESAPPPKTGAPDTFQGMTRGGMSTSWSKQSMKVLAHAMPIEQLAQVLAYQVKRTVVDKTGLSGQYDVALTFALDNGVGPAADSTAPPIFTALQEQLGLKLEAAKGPVTTLIVDHVDPPTEN